MVNRVRGYIKVIIMKKEVLKPIMLLVFCSFFLLLCVSSTKLNETLQHSFYPYEPESSLRSKFAGAASFWNPENEEISDVGQNSGGEEIAISVPANSALFVVFEKI